MTTRHDEDWVGVTVPVNADAPITGSQWSAVNPHGHLTLISDPTEPRGSGVLRMVYPVGLTGGGRPGSMYISMPTVREWYVCQWVKWSTGWEWNTVSQKHFYALISTGIHIQVRWGGSQIFSLYNQGGGEEPVLNTTNPTPPDDDTWHMLEWHCDLVAGRSSHWLDGSPLLVNASISNALTLTEFQIDSTWGGGGGPKAQEDYRYDGSTYISYRA
jgi:hypothetical protein